MPREEILPKGLQFPPSISESVLIRATALPMSARDLIVHLVALVLPSHQIGKRGENSRKRGRGERRIQGKEGRKRRKNHDRNSQHIDQHVFEKQWPHRPKCSLFSCKPTGNVAPADQIATSGITHDQGHITPYHVSVHGLPGYHLICTRTDRASSLYFYLLVISHTCRS